MNPSSMVQLLKETYSQWNEDKAPQLGAALAYYTIFSIAPLLVIVIGIVGLVFGEQAARGEIVGRIEGVVGTRGALLIQSLIESAGRRSAGLIGTILGTATLLLGALGIVGQLKAALNTIWDVEPSPIPGLLNAVKARAASYAVALAVVLGVGFIFLLSLGASTLLAVAAGWLSGLIPGLVFLLRVANFLLSFAVITVLCAMIYKILPDAETSWGDVWIGAAVTALLFVVGEILLGLYFSLANVGSAFGAAGSLVVLLVWVYYAAQILFLGAEFTQVYARRYGSRVVPAPGAAADTGQPVVGQGRPVGGESVATGGERAAAGRRPPAEGALDRRRAAEPRARAPISPRYAALGIGLLFGLLIFGARWRRA